ncbi:dynamin family protein [Actinomadura sp. HBU206391]|uniref:dynamin family protein n=1 Tax=Actinomadura sp. HBU206391 TaxID=2731692 RepID=UPI0016501711|nr:dynamin family protein [Actinomadura sp. HBU206391]MBC6457025.1 dynamin family protein [Actinomadura sp. HBU206391]
MSHPGFEAVRTDVLALCNELGNGLSNGPGDEAGDEPGRMRPPATSLQELDAVRAELAAPFYVVVCGEFSRGKSSMLNALIERPGLFPVDTAITTSVVTELRWGERETATVVSGDGVLTEKEVPVDQVADFVTEQGNPGNRQRVRLVRLTAPIERLRHGLALVDTPGIGSLNVEHAMATYAFLSKADAVLFVGAADERMSAAELSYLKDAIDRCPTVITVLTKSDKLVDPGPAGEVSVARERIAQISGLAADEVHVVGVSARRKMTAIERGDPGRLRRSGFPELEELLWRRLAVTLGAERLHGALDVLHEVVTAMAAPVSNELAALAGDQTLHDTRARLEELQERAGRLASRTADWRQDLAAAFQVAVLPVQEHLDAGCEGLLADFLANVHVDRYLDDPHALVRKAAVTLVDVMQRAEAELRAAATGTAARTSEQTRLPLAVDVRLADRDEAVSLELAGGSDPNRDSGGRFMTLFNSAGIVGGIGASLGAIGGLLFPGVGAVAGVAATVIGNLVGLFMGFREYAERARLQRQERAELLIDEVLPLLRERVDSVRTIFTESVEATRESLLADFDARIAATQESLAGSIAALEELRSATELQRSSRHAELVIRQRRLRGIEDRLAAVRQRIGTFG